MPVLSSDKLLLSERKVTSPAIANLSETDQSAPAGYVNLRVVQEICAVLTKLGVNSHALVAEANLEPRLLAGGRSFVSFAALSRLMAFGAPHTHCPHLGLLVGQRTTLRSLGLLGLLLRNSETVGDALRALETHLSLYNRGAAIGLGVYSDIAVLTYASHEGEAEVAGLHGERALAKATNILRALCGPSWAPLEVLLPRSVPHDGAPYKTFFRAPVRFNQDAAALVFPTSLLQQRIENADPALRRKVEDRLRRHAAAERCTLTDELRLYLGAAVTRQRCRAMRVARLRMIGRRTLSRRLKAEGTSFKQLANEAQFRVARQLLADTSMSIAQISAVLDFSEPAAFTHAFRRWAGMTPSTWRLEAAMAIRRLTRPKPKGC
ncbi:Helix-turn-helix-domain containing protein AraC type [Methylorubrum extorquens]|uniref:Helix-turn-helix-domain containing protein AraC type n=1 Tax=Methylorubrum extorquens TaxID=408 RepID=A0A2N9AYV9_METEX|nr:Helix-turn-helix-domain containing protein AraC type [Methylorubrum extorquens]